MAKAEILSIRDVSTKMRAPYEPTHKEVQYRIDDGPVMVLGIPLGEYSAAKAQELVGRKLKEWEDVVGKPITPR